MGPAVSTAAAMGPLLSGSGGRIAGAPSPVKIFLLFQSRGATEYRPHVALSHLGSIGAPLTILIFGGL